MVSVYALPLGSLEQVVHFLKFLYHGTCSFLISAPIYLCSRNVSLRKLAAHATGLQQVSVIISLFFELSRLPRTLQMKRCKCRSLELGLEMLASLRRESCLVLMSIIHHIHVSKTGCLV